MSKSEETKVNGCCVLAVIPNTQRLPAVSFLIADTGQKPTRISFTEIIRELNKYDIYYKIIPHKGILSRNRWIIINPIFSQDAEILMHELLHHIYPDAPECWVLPAARELMDRYPMLEDFLDHYCKARAVTINNF